MADKRRQTTPKLKPEPDYPSDPRELARAIFRDADRKRARRKREKK